MMAWLRIGQAATGALLLILAWFSGAPRVPLIMQGERTTGRVVDYEQARVNNRGLGNMTRPGSTFLPVVEFDAAGESVRFTDWAGSQSRAGINQSVTVFYDPARPSSAMVDRLAWNWFPWAPFAAIGGLLLLSSLRGKRG